MPDALAAGRTTVADMTLAPDTARRLATLAKRIDDTLEKRDRAIVEAHLVEGAGLREIGRAVGLSHVGVKSIIERRQLDFVLQDAHGRWVVRR